MDNSGGKIKSKWAKNERSEPNVKFEATADIGQKLDGKWATRKFSKSANRERWICAVINKISLNGTILWYRNDLEKKQK